MKAQLIVVQGKPEGKVIPLLGPIFRIGRGETCHLRPNSERVSREHAEFTVSADRLVVRDLGSRNGTLVNGKALTQPHVLKDRDQVQVGPLTFAVSIQDAPQAVPAMSPPPVVVAPPPGEPAPALLEAWSVADDSDASPSRGSETIMIPAFLEANSGRLGIPIPTDDDVDAEYERHPVVDGETVLDIPAVAPGEAPEAPPARKPQTRTGDRRGGDAASDILRKMMERGRVSK